MHSLILILVWLGAGAFGGTCAAAAPRWWPQFRGPAATGVADPGDFPTAFGPGTNVLWQTALPPGPSSPCIWSNHLFVTAFENNQLLTLALDRRDGRILWRQAVEPGKMERGVRGGQVAASTPCADGQRVYVYFGSFGLLCYDFTGQEQWRLPLPTPITGHGASSSPVLASEVVVLARDADVDAHLLAVRRRDGQEVWRANRPAARRGFATPLLWREGALEQVIVAGTLRLSAYDARDGREVWSVRGLPNEVVASPIAGEGLLFAAGWTPGSGVPKMPAFDALLAQADANHDGAISQNEAPQGPARHHFLYLDADKDGLLTRAEWEAMAEIFDRSENALLAVRPGGRGEVTATHLAWKQNRGLPYVGTPLTYRGRVYLLKNGGMVSCFNATNGTVCYLEERLGVIGDNYASLVAANGKICAASQSGTVAVFSAGDTLEVLARNKLGEPVQATPAIVEDKLYLRTEKRLYAFGSPR